MYGRPLLRDDSPSNLRFTVLLNPPMFEDHSPFQAEYLLMHDDKRIRDHFSLARKPNKLPSLDLAGPMRHLLSRMPGGANGPGSFAFEDYITWNREPERTLPRKDLLPRPALEKWLHAHFLKLALPAPREKFSDRPVHAPLNLTTFFRLVCLLSQRGYPAHWLSAVLASLCSGEITTTARPPRQIATARSDLDAAHPPKPVSVAPWRAEFTTLLSIWARLLPFGCVAPPGALVRPGGIVEYSVAFPPFAEEQVRVPHFVLVFWHSSARQVPRGRSIRALLAGEEAGGMRSAPGSCVHVFSVFRCDCRQDGVVVVQGGRYERDGGGWVARVYLAH